MIFEFLSSFSVALLNCFVDVSIKSLLILAPAYLLIKFSRKLSAFWKENILTTALAGLLIITLVVPFIPSFVVEFISSPFVHRTESVDSLKDLYRTERMKVAEYAKTLSSAEARDSILDSVDEDTKTRIEKLTAFKLVAKDSFPYSLVGFIVWGAGAVLTLLWLMTTGIMRRQIVLQARLVNKRSWFNLVESVKSELNLKRDVLLFWSEQTSIAFTYGTFKPVVVLPWSSVNWEQSKRRIVLLHELAHIKRKDSIKDALIKTVSVIHWFNPLVHFAIRQLRVERERASDDMVLNSGVKASRYARVLMDVAEALAGQSRLASHIAYLSQGGSLKDRILFILNPVVGRSTYSRFAIPGIGFIALVLIIPLLTMSFIKAQPITQLTNRLDTLSDEYTSLMVSQIGSSNQQIQLQAVRNMMRIDRSLFPAIIKEAISNPDSTVRRAVIEILASRDRFYVISVISDLWQYMADWLQERAEAELEFLSEYRDDSSFLNGIGYNLIERGKLLDALEVFQANAELYPESSNAFDSLGELYLKLAKPILAIENYRKSVQLNPGNKKAISIIRSIESGEFDNRR